RGQTFSGDMPRVAVALRRRTRRGRTLGTGSAERACRTLSGFARVKNSAHGVEPGRATTAGRTAARFHSTRCPLLLCSQLLRRSRRSGGELALVRLRKSLLRSGLAGQSVCHSISPRKEPARWIAVAQELCRSIAQPRNALRAGTSQRLAGL